MTPSCTDCQKPIGRGNKSGKCNACFHGMDRRVRIAELYHEGKSLTAIGKELGMSKQGVRGVLHRSGVLGGEERRLAETSDAFFRRSAREGSERLLAAYYRLFAGLPRVWSNRCPAPAAQTIAHLDTLSRTRALTEAESLALERAMHEDRSSHSMRGR